MLGLQTNSILERATTQKRFRVFRVNNDNSEQKVIRISSTICTWTGSTASVFLLTGSTNNQVFPWCNLVVCANYPQKTASFFSIFFILSVPVLFLLFSTGNLLLVPVFISDLNRVNCFYRAYFRCALSYSSYGGSSSGMDK